MGRFAKVSRRKRLSNNIFQATGNFAKSRPSPACYASNQPADSMVSGQIPYAGEQGMFGAVSGKDIGNTHQEQGIVCRYY